MLNIKRINDLATVPTRGSEVSSGLDLYSTENVIIPVGENKLIGTGWQMSVPKGTEIQIRPRSGLALKHCVTVNNSPGTVDSDFRGEIKVILINLGKKPFEVKLGDRIAQMVIQEVKLWAPQWVQELDSTERGTGGFGSTGV